MRRQHLNRSHQKPDFYCRRCYVTFKTEIELDNHSKQQITCERSLEDKFQDKMSDQQTKDIKKKRPRMDMAKSWNLIFTILFPRAAVPESPCKVGPNEVY
jgi:hypothetical protein